MQKSVVAVRSVLVPNIQRCFGWAVKHFYIQIGHSQHKYLQESAPMVIQGSIAEQDKLSNGNEGGNGID